MSWNVHEVRIVGKTKLDKHDAVELDLSAKHSFNWENSS